VGENDFGRWIQAQVSRPKLMVRTREEDVFKEIGFCRGTPDRQGPADSARETNLPHKKNRTMEGEESKYRLGCGGVLWGGGREYGEKDGRTGERRESAKKIHRQLNVEPR